MKSTRSRHLPNTDRVSILAASILFAFLLTQYVSIPVWDVEIQLPGLFILFSMNFNTIVTVIVAGLTATGADWLIRDHPALMDRQTVQHWLLPALTAWVIGAYLFTIPYGITWFIAFVVGGILLMLVLLAEFIVVDPQDARYPLASAALAALAFGLFLALAITLHAAGLRLFWRVPILIGAAFLVSARVFHLKLEGRWVLWHAMAISLISGQLAAALHYWPLVPSSFGLLVLAPIYMLVNFLSALEKNQKVREALIEPLLVLIVIVALAVWMQ
jgi:hypothetical protein